MTRTPDPGTGDASQQARLLALLRAGDVDAALQAGLMDYPASATEADAPIRAAQERLRTAWEARERHRTREARLARQAAERASRRAAASATRADPAPTAEVATPAAPAPALPPAAAAALARARAKAAGRPPA